MEQDFKLNIFEKHDKPQFQQIMYDRNCIYS
jgi:hypothetical protein